jgi:acyl carrier protein
MLKSNAFVFIEQCTILFLYKETAMTKENEYKNVVVAAIKEVLSNRPQYIDVDITDELALIGDNSSLDSMSLVELCLALEDAAIDLGKEFDWRSATAMSRSRSMFRSVGTLREEFARQMREQ